MRLSLFTKTLVSLCQFSSLYLITKLNSCNAFFLNSNEIEMQRKRVEIWRTFLTKFPTDHLGEDSKSLKQMISTLMTSHALGVLFSNPRRYCQDHYTSRSFFDNIGDRRTTQLGPINHFVPYSETWIGV